MDLRVELLGARHESLTQRSAVMRPGGQTGTVGGWRNGVPPAPANLGQTMRTVVVPVVAGSSPVRHPHRRPLFEGFSRFRVDRQIPSSRSWQRFGNYRLQGGCSSFVDMSPNASCVIRDPWRSSDRSGRWEPVTVGRWRG